MKRKKIDENQISLFDIELPPNEPEAIERAIKPTPVVVETAPPKISFARVPDEEFKGKYPFKDRPTVSGILKLLEKGSAKYGKHEFLSDVFECGAIAISNRFDFQRAEEREKSYLQIIKKYDKESVQILTQVFAEIYRLLTAQIFVGFDDYLGQLYMQSETSNSRSGQFFTPYCISKMCAECVVNKGKIEKAMEQDEILTMHEPTVGAGGMVIAAADVLYNKYHFNISRNLLVECGDIDKRCVHMTYLQLGLAGIPAVIFHRDGITLETWDRWETPAYIMQYSRFKNFFKGTPSDWSKTK